jgi:Novel STAND NTPase 1
MTTVSLPVSDRATRDSPWPGLRSYDEDEQEFFQGRPREAAELLRLVKRDVLTVFFGISGIGKSSLLKAGLFPLLRREGLLPIRIRLGFSQPSPDLARDVRRSFEADVQSRGLSVDRTGNAPAAGTESLWAYFHSVRVWDHADRLTPVLVLDQFEEVFTLGGAGGAAASVQAFIAELADLVENQIPSEVRRQIAETRQPLSFAADDQPYRVVLALREDYLAYLEGLALRMPSLNKRSRFRLLPMTAAQALDAVVTPGAGVITPPVARQIIDAISFTRRSTAALAVTSDGATTADGEVEPFLLSLVCRELNTRRQERGLPMISAELLQSSQGGVEQILGDFYERCFAGLTPSVKVFVEDELVGRTGFRQMVALDDLAGQPQTESAVQALVARRLLRIEEDRQGVARVELTHDVLTPIAVLHRNRRLLEEQGARALREQRAARRRQLVFAMAILLIVAIGGMAVAAWQWQKHRAVAADLAKALKTAEDARRAAEQSRLLAEQRLEAKQAADYAAKAALESVDSWKQAQATGSQAARQQGQRLQDVAQTALAASSRIGRTPPAAIQGRPSNAAPAPGPTQVAPNPTVVAAPARIVYIQVRDQHDADDVSGAVVSALRKAGFVVPQPEILATGPTATEVRFFRPEDKAAAQQIAELLRQAGLAGTIKEVAGYPTKLGEPHIEIWFEAGFFFP